MIPWLDEKQISFPPVETALQEPNGLLAAGGNLFPQTLLQAYRLGIFPWYADPDPILWWSPEPRCVLSPGDVHISKSMQKLIRHHPFSVTCDTAFKDVMTACSQPRDYTDETWITDDMLQAYCDLHDLGHAHSIEVWQDKELVGGIYGIAIGAAFFGESMFSRVSNSSKVAFISLCQSLERAGFTLIDCQVESPHLKTLGAYNITRQDFQQRLKDAINTPLQHQPWDSLS